MRGNDFIRYADARLAVSENIPADWKLRSDMRDAYRAGYLAEVCASLFGCLPDEEKARFAKWYAVEASDG